MVIGATGAAGRAACHAAIVIARRSGSLCYRDPLLIHPGVPDEQAFVDSYLIAAGMMVCHRDETYSPVGPILPGPDFLLEIERLAITDQPIVDVFLHRNIWSRSNTVAARSIIDKQS